MANARGRPHNFIDLSGKRFGRLTVINVADRTTSGTIRWDCVCDCGGRTKATTSSLRNGNVTSCGCYGRERAAARMAKRSKTHGWSKTKLYKKWRSMLDRCEDCSNKKYRIYGARGVRVCDDWHRFEPFLEWALMSGYSESAERGNLTLDRVDTNGNYEPDNCRFISTAAQNRNKRTNVMVSHNGKTMTAAEWSRELGGSRNLVSRRLSNGWDKETAVTTPVHKEFDRYGKCNE